MSRADYAARVQDAAAGSGPDLAALAAAVRAAAGDLALYTRVLLEDLRHALPAEDVTVERSTSLRQRLAGKAGPVTAVSLRLGQQQFSLRQRDGSAGPLCTVDHVVGGVTLQSTESDLDAWSGALALALRQAAATSQRSREALERLLET